MEDCERKYKEAFNMAVLEHKSDNEAVRESIERIFPQLKEPGGEKIRKALMNFFDGWGDKIWDSGIKYSEVVAWLQKQGDQKPAWSEEDKGVLLESISVLQSSSYWVLADKLKSLKDRVGCEVNCTTTSEPVVRGNKGNYGGISLNSEWSEDDEEKFRDVIRLIEQGAPVQSMRDHYNNWLKSLKDRVGNFDDGYKVGFSAAKHNQWKPNDEQMKILSIYAGQNNYHGTVLTSLYQDLKKLKG